MKLVQPTPDWLAQFNRNFDGVAGQVTNVTIDGKPYEMSFVCKPDGLRRRTSSSCCSTPAGRTPMARSAARTTIRRFSALLRRPSRKR